MTSLFSSGKRHVIKRVMTTRALSLFTGKRHVIDEIRNNDVNFQLKSVHFEGVNILF